MKHIQKWFELMAGISREEIAQYVGTATESLIRTLSDFKAEKLIEIKEGNQKGESRQCFYI